jgi:hypothetical protein
MYLPDRQMQTPFGMPLPIQEYAYLGKYLLDEWGIDVKRQHRVVKGLPDEDKPGRFKIDVLAFSHLPISTFTDHAIGQPLQGQRVFWVNACPVDKAKDSPGVAVEPLLVVPEGRRDVWATRDVGRLIDQIRYQQGGFIEPDYKGGDLPAPLSLALAASRSADKDLKCSESRIVVLGVGMSMIDQYVDEQFFTLDAKGGVSPEDPPKRDTDVLVNSIYWLSGHKSQIAAGPAKTKPIKPMSETTLTALKAVCLAGLPLLVLGTGALVLFIRRL